MSRHHPPRPQAGQHQGPRRRRREGPRLRPGQGARSRATSSTDAATDLADDDVAGDDPDGRHPRHRGVHGARTGEGQASRQACGHLGVRRRVLRDADRAAVVRGRERDRDIGAVLAGSATRSTAGRLATASATSAGALSRARSQAAPPRHRRSPDPVVAADGCGDIAGASGELSRESRVRRQRAGTRGRVGAGGLGTFGVRNRRRCAGSNCPRRLLRHPASRCRRMARASRTCPMATYTSVPSMPLDAAGSRRRTRDGQSSRVVARRPQDWIRCRWCDSQYLCGRRACLLHLQDSGIGTSDGFAVAGGQLSSFFRLARQSVTGCHRPEARRSSTWR